MSSLLRIRRTTTLLALVFATLLAVGCGGEGSSSSTGSGVASSGSLAVFLTDAPSDDFDQINVTVTKIELIGAEKVVVFEGSETVDLKDLENFSDLFVFADEVPVGLYRKIRLTVTEVELVRDEGGTLVSYYAKVPAHGKIDLLARSGFAIEPGSTLLVELDIDARRSIHVHPVRSGEYRFRPVVFVTILSEAGPAKLARVHGVVTAIGTDSFELCSTVFLAAKPAPAGTSKPANTGTGDLYRCITVNTDGDTSVFDANGDPAAIGDLAVEDEVTAIGFYTRVLVDDMAMSKKGHGDSDTRGDSHSDTDSDDDDGSTGPEYDIEMNAVVLEIGAAGTFQRLAGIVTSDLDAMDEFDFAIAPGQGFGDSSTVKTALQTGTRIFSKEGDEVDSTEIVADTAGTVDGVLVIDPMSSLLKAALLVLEIKMDAVAARGPILTIDEPTRTLEIDDAGTTVCVVVADDAEVFLTTEDGTGAVTEPAEFTDLTVDMLIDAYGEVDVDTGCVNASKVVGFVDAGPVI